MREEGRLTRIVGDGDSFEDESVITNAWTTARDNALLTTGVPLGW